MNIAINGFGRIGRSILKIAIAKKLDIVAINDTHGIESAVYALKFDSIYGKYHENVEAKGSEIIIGGKKIKVLNERDPLKLPWKKLKVDLVVESTGAFTKAIEAKKHLISGAKKVIITAPSGDSDITIVPGVNDSWLKKEHKIISLGSCTTNCAATIARVLIDNFGVNYAMLTTVHAYTNDQVILDNPHHNIRRGRAAGLNMVPTTTGAAEAVIAVIPELKGKMTGLSVRVPVSCGSLIDLTIEATKNVNIKEVNSALERASKKNFKGIIEYNTEPLVSSDVIGNSHSAVVDSLLTQVEGNLIKVLAWYDNEFGYSNRVVDVIKKLSL